MAPIPIITLYQGAGPGTSGVALIGTIGAGVVHCVANTPPTATRWRWSWIGGPPGSAIVRAQGVQDSKTLTTYSFTPDLAGGYLLQLDEFDVSGAIGTAYLMFAVLNPSSRLPHIPAMRAFPGFSVPDPFTCMNFAGFTPGWGDFQEEYWTAVDSGGGPTITPIDSFTLHQWLCNDAVGSSTIANTGSATTALTIQNTSFVKLGIPALYCDAIDIENNSSTYGYAKGTANSGNPTSTTQISVSMWVRPRAFDATFGRLISKGYNPTFVSPYGSFEIIYAGTTSGQLQLQWVAAGVEKAVVIGPSTATTIGYLLLNQWQHIGVTFSETGGTATINYYWNGNLITSQTTSTGAIDWNVGSSGSWYLGGVVAAGPVNNACLVGETFDVRVDDGVVRSLAYYKAMYKLGVGSRY